MFAALYTKQAVGKKKINIPLLNPGVHSLRHTRTVVYHIVPVPRSYGGESEVRCVCSAVLNVELIRCECKAALQTVVLFLTVKFCVMLVFDPELNV